MKRIIAFLLCAAFLAALALSPVSALAAKDSDKTVFLNVLNAKNWEKGEGASSVSNRVISARNTLSVSAESGAEELSFSGEFRPVELSGVCELVLELSVRGEGEAYPVTVNLISGSERFTYSDTLPADDTFMYVPLKGNFAKSLTGITFTADTKDAPLNYIIIHSITADNNYTYSYRDLFGSTRLTSEHDFKRAEDSFTVSPKDGLCEISLYPTEGFSENRDLCFWVSLSGASGSISAVTVSPEGKETAYTAQSITADGTYCFTLRGGLEQLSLRFSLVSKDTKAIKLTGAGILDLGEHPESIGTVTSCRYDGKKVTLQGSLSGEASVDYYGSRILMYAIPLPEAENFKLSDYEPCATSGFSTKFSLSQSFDPSFGEYLYVAVLDTKEGKIIIDSPSCAASSSLSTTSKGSVCALHGADAADVFETNASSVIIDVAAGNLVETSNIYSAISYSYHKTYYFNRDYVEALDSKVQFYRSAGIGVYLRIYSDRDGYTFDYSADSPESLSLMCALSGFLADRYSGVEGFIMGNALNSYALSPSPKDAESKARLVCAFAERIKAYSPDSAVVLPFSAEVQLDCHLSAHLLYYYLGKYNRGGALSLLEVTRSPEGSVQKAQRLSQISSLVAGNTDGCAVFWHVPGESTSALTVSTYKKLCGESISHALRFCALSVTRTDRSAALFDALSSMLDSENVISSSTSQFKATALPFEAVGSFSLWDFTDSYDTTGWVAGGSFAAPITARGSGGGRVLLASKPALSSDAGILIGKITSPKDLSKVSAGITLNVLSDSAKAADVSLIFGSGESRAEFSASVSCNEKATLYCDMSAFGGASKIDYVALIVRGGDDLRAEVSKVELFSDKKNSEALSAEFSDAVPEEHDPVLYAVVIIAAAVTVAVFSALLRKQKSPAGARKAQKEKKNDKV